jgi:hypothetical protein
VDLALDEICDKECNKCTNKDAQLCRRWVPEFRQSQGELVAELREENKRWCERVDEGVKLVKDAMTYIIVLKQKKLISNEAFNRLRDRAERLGVYTKELEEEMRAES